MLEGIYFLATPYISLGPLTHMRSLTVNGDLWSASNSLCGLVAVSLSIYLVSVSAGNKLTSDIPLSYLQSVANLRPYAMK